MSTWTSEEILGKVVLGMSRQEAITALGRPDAEGGTSRKYRTPTIYKYGDIELWFKPWKSGSLYGVWHDRQERMLLGSPTYER